MEALKCYTDFEQSKILKDILPFESADGGLTENYNCVPCWSLVALLNFLPANKLEKEFDGKWRFSVYLPSGQHKSHKHDNPIDACYELIIKLNELKLL